MNTRDEEGNNTFKYTLTEPANLSLEPTVTAEIVSDKDQYLFVYVDAGNAKRVKYVTNTANEDRERLKRRKKNRLRRNRKENPL